MTNWLSGNLNGLIDVQYRRGATDLIARVACGMCDAELYNERVAPAEAEAVCMGIAAHLGKAHGIKVEFHICHDPGCRNTN